MAGLACSHIILFSRSQKILWLLEELELNYVVKTYKRVKGLAPPELKEVHPLGKVPIITDGTEVVAESGCSMIKLSMLTK